MQTFMGVTIIVALSIAPSVTGVGQGRNTATLNGGPPTGYNVLPPLPPRGFYAWCETPRGVCPVQGNAPIPPRSLCHCAENIGRTV